MYSHLEDYIYELYMKIGITKPSEMDMFLIAKLLGVVISYQNRAIRMENEIALNKGTIRSEWMMFGHEICHYLRHVGIQLVMNKLFVDLQEYQADYFAYHFCVPTFMLDKLDISCAEDIIKHFEVDYEFALRRLEMYENKQYTRSVSL
ncbi:ImmA/IrrE family metallo-endopeptidase [Oceanobacillus locisalsi]|uniref:ImmA/IrrE family metallo-endopeptidase n=1 Tax=Oceanobacillus locisalsi TaxID=546107 RepID=A0ABW3NHU3_9BACI